MIDQEKKEKILEILNKLVENQVLTTYCMNDQSQILIDRNKTNEYIMKKFNEIGIEAELVKLCDTPHGPCDNYFLTEEDAKNQEWCSSYDCIYNHIGINIPYIPRKENKEIIDEIFEKEVI